MLKMHFRDKNDSGDEFHYILVSLYLRSYRDRFIDMENRTNVEIIIQKSATI
jgi:hypothetical protein